MGFFSRIVDVMASVLGIPGELIRCFNRLVGGIDGSNQIACVGALGRLGGCQSPFCSVMGLGGGFLDDFSLLVSVPCLLVGHGQLRGLSRQMHIVAIADQRSGVGFHGLLHQQVRLFGKAMGGSSTSSDRLGKLMGVLARTLSTTK